MRGDALMAPAEVMLDIRNYVTVLTWAMRKGDPNRRTVCQNERKMTSLIATTLRSGLCSARSPLS